MQNPVLALLLSASLLCFGRVPTEDQRWQLGHNGFGTYNSFGTDEKEHDCAQTEEHTAKDQQSNYEQN
jgi:hypothetical protein